MGNKIIPATNSARYLALDILDNKLNLTEYVKRKQLLNNLLKKYNWLVGLQRKLVLSSKSLTYLTTYIQTSTDL